MVGSYILFNPLRLILYICYEVYKKRALNIRIIININIEENIKVYLLQTYFNDIQEICARAVILTQQITLKRIEARYLLYLLAVRSTYQGVTLLL